MISAKAVAVSLDSSIPKGALNMWLYPSACIYKIVDDIEGSIYVSTLQLINSGDVCISVLTASKYCAYKYYFTPFCLIKISMQLSEYSYGNEHTIFIV